MVLCETPIQAQKAFKTHVEHRLKPYNLFNEKLYKQLCELLENNEDLALTPWLKRLLKNQSLVTRTTEKFSHKGLSELYTHFFSTNVFSNLADQYQKLLADPRRFDNEALDELEADVTNLNSWYKQLEGHQKARSVAATIPKTIDALESLIHKEIDRRINHSTDSELLETIHGKKHATVADVAARQVTFIVDHAVSNFLGRKKKKSKKAPMNQIEWRLKTEHFYNAIGTFALERLRQANELIEEEYTAEQSPHSTLLTMLKDVKNAGTPHLRYFVEDLTLELSERIENFEPTKTNPAENILAKYLATHNASLLPITTMFQRAKSAYQDIRFETERRIAELLPLGDISRSDRMTITIDKTYKLDEKELKIVRGLLESITQENRFEALEYLTTHTDSTKVITSLKNIGGKKAGLPVDQAITYLMENGDIKLSTKYGMLPARQAVRSLLEKNWQRTSATYILQYADSLAEDPEAESVMHLAETVPQMAQLFPAYINFTSQGSRDKANIILDTVALLSTVNEKIDTQQLENILVNEQTVEEITNLSQKEFIPYIAKKIKKSKKRNKSNISIPQADWYSNLQGWISTQLDTKPTLLTEVQEAYRVLLQLSEDSNFDYTIRLRRMKQYGIETLTAFVEDVQALQNSSVLPNILGRAGLFTEYIGRLQEDEGTVQQDIRAIAEQGNGNTYAHLCDLLLRGRSITERVPTKTTKNAEVILTETAESIYQTYTTNPTNQRDTIVADEATKSMESLKSDIFYGDEILSDQITPEAVSFFGTENLFSVGLPQRHKLIYSIENNKGQPRVIIQGLFDNAGYEQLFIQEKPKAK